MTSSLSLYKLTLYVELCARSRAESFPIDLDILSFSGRIIRGILHVRLEKEILYYADLPPNLRHEEEERQCLFPPRIFGQGGIPRTYNVWTGRSSGLCHAPAEKETPDFNSLHR